jgi:excisionase family DNA binding protein
LAHFEDPAAEGVVTRLLTAEELADRWQVPKSQVYRLAREGRIPTVEIGRYYRFSPAAIEAFENGTTDTMKMDDAAERAYGVQDN